MELRTLILTPWYQPHNVVNWRYAISMKYEETAEVLSEYKDVISSVSLSWKVPAVMRLKSLPKIKDLEPKFSRQAIFIRDNFQCQYCLNGFEPSKLTIDHVVPRALGGKTTWTNCCCACIKCNSRKGSHSCEYVRMFPFNKPVKPKTRTPGQFISYKNIPDEWEPFIRRDLCFV